MKNSAGISTKNSVLAKDELPQDLVKKIKDLALKYENSEFLLKDPSQFMHRFSNSMEQEVVAFTAASLAFGQRKQILSHVEIILEQMEQKPVEWILSEKYKSFFTQGKKSFYRMYTHDDMVLFFDGIKKALEEYGSLGNCIKNKWNQMNKEVLQEKNKEPEINKALKKTEQKIYLHQAVCSLFSKECGLIPHGKDTAAKKVNMFLRWMVRKNSPVDLGLWDWYLPKDLLMPLDVHVMQQSTELGLLDTTSTGKIKSANIKTCIELTEKLKQIFPEDPVKADFALFGLGVDEENRLQ